LTRILPYPFDGEEHHDRQLSKHEQLEDMSGCALVSFSGDAEDGDVAEAVAGATNDIATGRKAPGRFIIVNEFIRPPPGWVWDQRRSAERSQEYR
jgi:hypothetical protein